MAKKVKKTAKKSATQKTVKKKKVTKKTPKKSVVKKAAKKAKKTTRKTVKKKTAKKSVRKSASKNSSKSNKSKVKMRRRRKTTLSKKELQHYRELLVEKLKEIVGDVDHIESEALKKSRLDASGDLSSMPIHMADIGSDNYEQEFALGLMDSERKIVHEIHDALKRIENGSYGICEGTGEPIPKARLEGIPWARYCVEYAEKLEKGLVSEEDHWYDYEDDEDIDIDVDADTDEDDEEDYDEEKDVFFYGYDDDDEDDEELV